MGRRPHGMHASTDHESLGDAGIPGDVPDGESPMSNYTRLGGNLWDWQPWVTLTNPSARLLWLGLYTTPEARRICPGLWHGSPVAMAEAARMPLQDALSALDALLEAEMVEFDPKTRVLRLSELPDAGEYPSNGNIIRGWWSKFRSVPQCAIRDAHIRTIRWIVDQGAIDSRKALSHHHHEAWNETFGTIPMPAVRRRGVKTVSCSDTSTPAQPSLFPMAPALPNTVPVTIEAGSVLPVVSPVDNSAVLRQSNEIRYPETVRERLGEGEGEGEIWISSGIRNDPPERSRSDNVTRLTLVPPYTVAEALSVLRTTKRYDTMYDEMHMAEVERAHAQWIATRVTLEDLALLADHQGRVSARDIAGIDMARFAERARSERKAMADRLAMLAEFKIPTSG